MEAEQSHKQEKEIKVPLVVEQSPSMRFTDAQKKATALFQTLEEKINKTPTLDTLVPFLIDSDGIAQLQKYFEQMLEEARQIPNSSVFVAELEKIVGDIKLWGKNILDKLQAEELADDSVVLKDLVSGLESIFDAIPDMSLDIKSALFGISTGVSGEKSFLTNEELKEKGLEGIGWRKEGNNVTAPAKVERTQTANIVVRKEQNLLERGDEGRADDNPNFDKFLIRVEEVIGRKIDKRNKKEMSRFGEAFEKRGKVATFFVGFFKGEMGKVLPENLPLNGLIESVSAHIEDLSVKNPEKIAEYHKLFDEAVAVQHEIEVKEAQRRSIVSDEERNAAMALLTEKEKVLSLARESNKFFTGLGRLTGFFAWATKKEKLKSQAGARAEAQEMGYGNKWLGSIGYQEIPFVAKGKSLGYGKVHKELGRIKGDLAKLTGEPEHVGALIEKRARLAEIKKQLLAESAMKESVARMTRDGVDSAFKNMFIKSLKPSLEELDKFERMERALADLVSVSEKGGDDDVFDSARKLGNPEVLKQQIRVGAEAVARGIITRALSETLANPESPGRRAALQSELSSLFSREKIGRSKSKREVRNFIIKELDSYLEEQETLLSMVTSEEERLAIRLRSAAVENFLAVQKGQKDSVSAEPSEQTSESEESPEEIVERTFKNVKTNNAGKEVKVETLKNAEIAETTAEQIPPQINTFQNVMDLNEEELRNVLQEVTMNTLSAAFSDELPDIVEKMRGCLSDEERDRFDRVKEKNHFYSETIIINAQKEIVKAAKEVLGSKLSS